MTSAGLSVAMMPGSASSSPRRDHFAVTLLSGKPEVLQFLLTILLHMVLFEVDTPNQFSMSRPTFLLVLLCDQVRRIHSLRYSPECRENY
jgi:hypothetical protein